jgi:hypothetical protein
MWGSNNVGITLYFVHGKPKHYIKTQGSKTCDLKKCGATIYIYMFYPEVLYEQYTYLTINIVLSYQCHNEKNIILCQTLCFIK